MPSYKCNHATCPQLLPTRGYCERHKSLADAVEVKRIKDKAYDALRDKDVVAFYNSRAWKETRREQLELEPICQHCRRAIAGEVHHVVSVKESIEKRLDRDNLLSLCHKCHMAIEARAKRARARV
jgi:5-methylcytosine-specific restriction protein A